eukprot:EG_transcript_2269
MTMGSTDVIDTQVKVSGEPALWPHFGQFVCNRCAESSSSFPFLPCEALEDLADLYLYRFDSTIDYDALARLSQKLRVDSERLDVNDHDFEVEACRSIQAMVDLYFMEEWYNPLIVKSNSKRLRAIRRKYLNPKLLHASKVTNAAHVPEVSERVWDFALSTGGLVLVLVTAEYCSGCNDLVPIFGAAAQTVQERSLASCYQLNGARNPNLVAKLKVKIYPCILLFSDGKEVGRMPCPKRKTYTDIVNFVLDYRYRLEFMSSAGLPDEGSNASNSSESVDSNLHEYEGPSDQPDSWWQCLRTRGIDMLEEMEADRRNVLLHEKFKALGGLHLSEFYQVPADWRPRIVFLGGGMGAGKSTVVRTMATTPFWHERGERVVIIEADAFKLQDPLFAALLHANVANAAEVVHNTSTATAEELLLDALQRNRDIVFDGTLSWEPFVQQTVAMVREAHLYEFCRGPGYQEDEAGNVTEEYWVRGPPRANPGLPYIVEMIGVTVSPEVAVQRGIVRHIMSGRGVPVRAQLQSHKLYSLYFMQYLSLFDAAALMDNSGGTLQAHPILIKGESIMRSSTDREEILVVDEGAYSRFLRKRFINIAARGMSEVYLLDEPSHRLANGLARGQPLGWEGRPPL